jgi:hypothetical protein
MPLEPNDWSVVAVGHWNRAILTPKGIGTRLFHVAPDTPLNIAVPIDSIAPYRINHQGVTVSVARERLMVEPDDKTFDGLRLAMSLSREALVSLPETPVSAVGINVRYVAAEPPPALRALIRSDWDDDLSDQGFQIAKSSIGRSVDWNGGSINISIIEDIDRLRVEFNMEKRSEVHEDHVEWLTTDIAAIQDVVFRLLTTTMHAAPEDILQ